MKEMKEQVMTHPSLRARVIVGQKMRAAAFTCKKLQELAHEFLN